MPVEIDIKLRLLNELIVDASKPRKQIAADLRVSESYVSKMAKELEYENLILKTTVHANYRELGYTGHYVSVFSLVSQRQDLIEDLVSLLMEMEEAIEVASVYGADGDILVRWLCRDAEELQSRINQILSTHAIKEVRTISMGKFFKREFGPTIAERDP